MSIVANRRTAFRMPFVSRLVCHTKENNKKHAGILRDISINGLFMEVEDCPAVGCQCHVDIYFEGTHSRLVVEKVDGLVVRSEPRGVAVKFDNRLEWFVLIPLFFHKISGKIHADEFC
jgi:hypothetical protein